MEKSEESKQYVTGVHRNIAEEDNVQIKANKDEVMIPAVVNVEYIYNFSTCTIKNMLLFSFSKLMNRISVFMQLKKKQVDFSNEQEFTSTHNKQSGKAYKLHVEFVVVNFSFKTIQKCQHVPELIVTW